MILVEVNTQRTGKKFSTIFLGKNETFFFGQTTRKFKVILVFLLKPEDEIYLQIFLENIK
jgi:hypothetical protein